ncbi:HNH endonuclease [Natrinema salsiterrestre]|uniref:HNH endonuclease n=1 Tax=Natrinema salsiterrestre TaxID=2950540 RepID=A0A9Q4L508_9EURY|nr:HNH endonuclease [Natrinema salsiterrestre]MDF9748431.1 HNH endonuclease [Natrinema salsiterrestre]
MSGDNTNTTEADGETWRQLREQRLEIDDHQCVNCGNSGMLHVHHVVPKSLGGVDELSNLRSLCIDCHDKAHDRSIGVIKGHYKSSDTRWLPSTDTMRWFINQIHHPLDRLVVIILAKTGIGVGELSSLTVDDIYLRDGGLGLTSTVERPSHPFFLLEETKNGPGSGVSQRLCDTFVPIGPELQGCLMRYLAIRPDGLTNKLLLGTGESWGEGVGRDGIEYIIRKHGQKVGFYESGAGATKNLTPNVFRQFFDERYQGQPAVRDYILGKKKKMQFDQGQIVTDYRESIYELLF